jgi:hypothetical protein
MSDTAAKRELVVVRVDEISPVDRPAIREEFLIVKRVVGSTALPLADRDTEWDGPGAAQRVRDHFTNEADEVDWTKVASAFFYVDPEAVDAIEGYRWGFADVIDGELVAVPNGIVAVAEAIQGAQGGEDIAEDDILGIQSKVEAYYEQLEMTPPWADEANDTKEGRTVKRSAEDHVIIAKAVAEKAALVAKAAEGDSEGSMPAHEALLREKLAAIVVAANKIATEGPAMAAEDLREKLSAMSRMVWSIEDAAGAVALTQRAATEITAGNELAALDVVREGIVRMQIELKKIEEAKAAEGDGDGKTTKEDEAMTDEEKKAAEEAAAAKAAEDEAAAAAKAAEDKKKAEGGGGEEDPDAEDPTAAKRFTKALVARLDKAIADLGAVLKEIGVESVTDLASAAVAEKAEGITKSLGAIGVEPDEALVKRIEARDAEVATLRKRIDELEGVGVSKALVGDGTPVVKGKGSGGLFKGLL